MAEEEIIRKRLCVEGEGGSDDRRVLSLLKTFVRWVSGPNPNPSLSEEERERERDATYQKMLFTLGKCRAGRDVMNTHVVGPAILRAYCRAV